MHTLQQLLSFAETAKHRSFARAAHGLGCAPSTLAKSVLRLERSLGVKLFHRTTRQVTLTPDGEQLYARCQRVLAEVEDLQAAAAGTRDQVGGALRIDMPTSFGRRFVVPLLAQLAERHPALAFDLRLSDTHIDIIKEGVDLTIRIGEMQDSGLVARRFYSQTLKLCASPAHLKRHGRPRSLADLSSHPAIAFRMPGTGRDRPWQFLRQGTPISQPVHARVRIGEGEAMVEAAIGGMGVIQVPDYIAQDALDRGALVELLPTMRPAPIPISAVYASQRLLPPRVRVVLDALMGLSRRA
jgi:LysR family transcriptional regulator, regulator for bpeEF and oprC